MEQELPFSVGDEVEQKTYDEGYRGAWFRAKILKIQVEDNQVWCDLQFFDYEESTEEILLYRTPPGAPATGPKEIMLRPKYPNRFMVTAGGWKVGDEADWMWNRAFWTGRILEFINENEVKFKCLAPPLGEGGLYTVSVSDLRPALVWSVEHGWRVPTAQASTEQNQNSVEQMEGDAIEAWQIWETCFTKSWKFRKPKR